LDDFLNELAKVNQHSEGGKKNKQTSKHKQTNNQTNKQTNNQTNKQS